MKNKRANHAPRQQESSSDEAASKKPLRAEATSFRPAFPRIAAGFVLFMACFGLIPDTFFNYGYDYFQFLPEAWLVGPILAIVVLFLFRDRIPDRTGRILLVLAVLFAPVLFWTFRTQVHCFGGDGAVGVVPTASFSASDFIPRLPGRGRLDGYLGRVVARLCARAGLFERSTVMPSILSTAVYSVAIGSVFAIVAGIAFFRRAGLFFMILTAPFVFNFFGNIDAYAFSLLIELVFLLASIPVVRSENASFLKLFGLGLLWGVGLWTHPFHVFNGFVLSLLFLRWLKRRPRFSRIPDWTFPVVFGLVLFAAIKCSPWGNTWFDWEFATPPPTFSLDTLTHYLNMILLPSLPLISACLLAGGGGQGRQKARRPFCGSRHRLLFHGVHDRGR